jgi:hypothetical protein
MHASTKRLALRAAAKAALSVTFFTGCGGMEMAQSEDDAAVEADPLRADAVAHDDASPSDARRAPTDGASLLCSTPPIGSHDPVSKETFECCDRVVQAALGDANILSDADTAQSADVDCCNAIVTAANDDHKLWTENAHVVGACCQALEQDGISTLTAEGGFGACDPWGPPVPPEMPDHLVFDEVA